MIPKMWLPSPLILATGSMNDTSHSPRPSDRLLRPCEVQRYLRATSLRLADARPVEKVGSDELHICGAKRVIRLEFFLANRGACCYGWHTNSAGCRKGCCLLARMKQRKHPRFGGASLSAQALSQRKAKRHRIAQALSAALMEAYALLTLSPLDVSRPRRPVRLDSSPGSSARTQ